MLRPGRVVTLERMKTKQTTSCSWSGALARAGVIGCLALVGASGQATAATGPHLTHETTPESVRPEVTFVAGNAAIDLPDEVPSGYVDIRIRAVDGEAHLALGRIADGTSREEFDAANPFERIAMLDVRGGNGTVSPGADVLLTLLLEPGEWVAVNIYYDGGAVPQFAFDQFTVVESDNDAPAPTDRGTIVIGPAMRIDVPDDFDAVGTWKFENHDDVLNHEAALVGLTDGSTTEDLMGWYADQSGPPPIRGEFGSMGALGPGHEGWVTFAEGALEPGPYSLICWVPGDDGTPHLMNGMFEDLTI